MVTNTIFGMIKEEVDELGSPLALDDGESAVAAKRIGGRDLKRKGKKILAYLLSVIMLLTMEADHSSVTAAVKAENTVKAAEKQNEHEVTIKLQDADDPSGSGIVGATVTIEGRGETRGEEVKEVATDNGDGRYTANLPEGDYTVTVEAEGYDTSSLNLRINVIDEGVTYTGGEEGITDSLTVKLKKHKHKVTINLQDADDPSGGGIVGATVTIKKTGETESKGVEATDDGDGSYTTKLPNGEYTVTVNAEGYDISPLNNFTIKVTDTGVEYTGGEESITDSLTVRLKKQEQQVTIKLQDATSESGIDGATVTITRKGDKGSEAVEVKDNKDGSYTANLQNGEYTVTVVKAEGYDISVLKNKELTISVIDTGVIYSDGESSNTDFLTVELEKQEKEVTIKLQDDPSGDGIDGAKVTIERKGEIGSESVKVDDKKDGSYTTNLQNGDYTVTVEAAGYDSPQNLTITVADEGVTYSGGETDGDSLTIRLEKEKATVTITVVSNGTAVSAEVTLEKDGESPGRVESVSGYTNVFEIDLEEGTYTLAVEASGYQDYSTTIQVDAGIPQNVSVNLEKKEAGVSIYVVDENGGSITDATVTLENDEADLIIAEDEYEKGIYTASITQDGEYTVEVSKEGYEIYYINSENITVEDGVATPSEVTVMLLQREATTTPPTEEPELTEEPTEEPTETPSADWEVTPTVRPTIKPTIKPTDHAYYWPNIWAKSVTVTYGKKPFPLKVDTDSDGAVKYSVPNSKVISLSVKKGKATATVKGYGKATVTIKTTRTKTCFAGKKKITVTVIPVKAVVTKLDSPIRRQLAVTWKKNTTVSKFQLWVSTDKQFKRGTIQRVLSAKKNSSKTPPLLKSGKTYYVKIRACKKIGKKKYYGAWSKVKSAKVK